MKSNINWYGALAMYIDKKPALELDTTQVAKDLKANFNEKYAKEAGVDVEKYNKAIATLKEKAKKHNEKIKSVNDKYEEAVSKKDTKKIAKLKKDGQKLNAASLKTFKAVQDKFLKCNDFQIYYGHSGINDNVKYLKGTIKGLENKDLWNDDEKSGALDNAWKINAEHDYGYCIFSRDIIDTVNGKYSPKGQIINQDYWGYQRMIPVINVGKTTHQLNKLSGQDKPKVDWKGAAKTYKMALQECIKQIKTYSNQEMKDMKIIGDMLQ